MPKLSYLKALNRALADEMERDENIILLGEDIKLGLTNATTGLYARFGDSRVLETPLSEQGFTNFATGAALVGRRPVVEFQIPFLLMLVFEQIANQANKFSIMSGGQARVPVTYLLPAAGWRAPSASTPRRSLARVWRSSGRSPANAASRSRASSP